MNLLKKDRFLRVGKKLVLQVIGNSFNSDGKILWIKIKASLNESHFNSLTIK